MIKSTSINYKTVKNILSKMTPYCCSYITDKRMKGKEGRREKKEGKEGGSKSKAIFYKGIIQIGIISLI